MRWAAGSRYGLPAVLLAALGLRLGLVPTKAQGDILLIGRWCKFVTLHGMEEAYDVSRYAAFTHAEGVTGYLATPTIYPPFLINLLALVGHLYQALGADLQVTAPAFLYALRAPAILADLVMTVLIFRFVRQRAGRRFALAAAAAYALNPAIAYTSGWSGHFDSVYSLFLVLAVWAAARRQAAWVGLWSALAVLTKLQAGAVLPLLAIVLWRLDGWSALPRAGLAGLLTTAAVFAPFIGAGVVPQMITAVTTSFGYYPYLSMGAFNFWHLVSWLGWGTFHGRHPDLTALWLGLTPRDLGLVMLEVVTLLLAFSLWRKPTLERITIAVALQAFGFFLLATEMHERYSFPALPLLALYLGHRLPTVLYIGLSITYFANLYALFWSWQPLGNLLWLQGWGSLIVALLNGVLFGWGIWRFVHDGEDPPRLGPWLTRLRSRLGAHPPGSAPAPVAPQA